MSATEQQLAATTAQAITAWRQSAAGQASMQTLEAIPLQERRIEDFRVPLDGLARSPEFAAVRDLVNQQRRVSRVDLSTYDVQSISVGFEASLVLGIGFQGSFGVAFPAGDFIEDPEEVLYISGNFEIGVAEGAMGGIVVGFWNSKPEDLAGDAWGWEVEIDDIVGFSVEASYANPSMTGLLGFSVAEDEGEEDGAEALYSYTYVLSHEAPLVYQVPRSHYMLITSIDCNQNGESGHDEVYFKFKVDGEVTYRYPTKGEFPMAKGDSWNAGRSIWLDSKVEISLFDNDDVNDDPRGSTTYTLTNFPTSVQVSASGGTYTIHAVLDPLYLSWGAGNVVNNTDTTPDTPSPCLFKNQVYLFWEGTNSHIYFSASADGQSWPNGAMINPADTTAENPTACALDGDLFVFWKGGNSGIYWTRSDGSGSWPNGVSIPGQLTRSAPAPCVVNDTLYLFYNASDTGRITYTTWSTASGTWSSPRTINNVDATSTAVAACVDNNNQIYLFWRNDSNHQIYFTSGTTSWPNGKSVNSGEATATAPAACVYQNQIVLFFPSNNSSQYGLWLSSANGQSWSSNTIANTAISSSTAFSALLYHGRIYLFWKDSGSKIRFSPSTT
jgi:hypothetical protein